MLQEVFHQHLLVRLGRDFASRSNEPPHIRRGRVTTGHFFRRAFKSDDGPETRALELLKEHLDERQWRELMWHNRFTIKSQHGNTYRIKWGKMQNIFKMEGEVPVLCLCFMLNEEWGEYATADHMLAQKLMLELDEDQALRIAHTFTACMHRDEMVASIRFNPEDVVVINRENFFQYCYMEDLPTRYDNATDEEG